ncbi:ABC transporter permease [Diplocloster agilis]|uniref:ABC transporter permease n=1 Tax=Diplocloster agilis TaxID=2850323 RepID=UPI00082269A8|nr:ABC transporter permease [Suonthocola fibrivorans]MCU6734398.1 ABC transporter permease [Suonthocola fibrivorans]SCJ37704.1 D-allose transport system permease protein AlsC [uncultured Clostridium sp.]
MKAQTTGKEPLGTKFKSFIKDNPNLSRLLVILLVVFALAAILKPELFYTKANFVSIAKQFPEYGLLAIGIGLAMIIGGIDLSVVGIANLCAMLAVKFLKASVPEDAAFGYTFVMIGAACLLACMVGILAGIMNGICISIFKIPAILTTLGTQQLFTGIAIVMSNGSPVSGLPKLYSRIGNANIGGILPVQLLTFIIFAVIIGIILSKTSMGTEMYMIGTNAKALLFTGLNKTWITVRAHLLSGLLAAVAGLIMMTRTNSAKAEYGEAYIMQGVLVCVLGGLDPNGGSGSVSGIVVAVIILQCLASVLNMYEQISNFYRNILWGAALIVVLIVNKVLDQHKARKAVKA